MRYAKTSQIVNLPGGPKRLGREIQDDDIKMNNYNHSKASKLIKDFKSNVACLPGPVKNNDSVEKGKLMSDKRLEKSDIFFSMKSNNILPPQPKQGGNKTNIGSERKEEVRGKSARPDNIKNPYESSIFR